MDMAKLAVVVLNTLLLISRMVACTLLAILLMPGAGAAIQASFQSGGGLDKLVLTFDAGADAQYSVRRVDRQQVQVTVAGETLATAPSLTGAQLVSSVEALEGGVLINLKTDAFGFISSPGAGAGQLMLQIFRDPIGSRWKPRGTPPADVRRLQPEAKPAQAQTAQTPARQTPATGQDTDPREPLGAPDPQAPSLYAVPYSVRVHVNGNKGKEIVVEPGEVIAYDPDTGAVQVRVADNGIREVTVAPPADLQQARAGNAPPPAKQSMVNDVMEAQLPMEGKAVEEPLIPLDEVAAETEMGAETMPEASEGEPQVADNRFFSRIMRSVTGLPGPGAEPPMEATTETQAQIANDLQQMPQVDDIAVQNALGDIAKGNITSESQAPNALDEMEQADAAVDPHAGMSEEDAKHLENLELQLLKAQSQVASGQLEDAKQAFEEILRDPLLPQELRLETTYSLGNVLMTLYKDSPQEHFEEVTSLFKEAMNANMKSENVPTALMNLGLINLWVGNAPEAKAYFDILSSQYPYDENVPAIGYYYGEHNYQLGEYEKAADLFQKFIETYPEQERLVRQAAFLLTDSLINLSLYDQAFQIVDYIDKRWPQAYEENPRFLKLAGDVEHHLGMTDRAKDHYWTYYNMNPKAEQSDVVLARLGDLYLEKNEPGAAKELYNRAIQDYPDMEGGLVAKMRLAEEGIHDSPTFMEMVSVFDKPFSLKPKQVYTEIVEQHPDSPLAPLALLKLGMWHFFQKEYAEALTAAQRMFTEYPRSTLIDRAKELGDRSFALAVPQLIEQENYQTVVDYWEQYNFANMSEGDEANTTRIGVAKSYAELNDFESALNLLRPFLGEEQVTTYSEMALAVAADIYLEQHAWNNIQNLARKVEEHWDLSDRSRRLMLHAEAVALENLGEGAKAVRLWAQLGSDETVEPYIRADAMYHLAKEAMNHQDLRRVFVYAQEALSQLLAAKGDEEKIKDCLLMSIYATERSGRYQQALEWALEYDKHIPKDDPEWAASRYRLARIYRKAGADNQWRDILKYIRDTEPTSLYGRLAATAIETDVLEDRAQEYAPIPN
ncbi:MAG: tetratricopeptide repeat protein [Proteobacteria bacterium]|nr:tetratricopeptide repeat protein [Pseudomonadota bacterium]